MTNSDGTQLREARKIGQASGYYVRRGEYVGGGDNNADRWYVGNRSDAFFRPFGKGFATMAAAWLFVHDGINRAGSHDVSDRDEEIGGASR